MNPILLVRHGQSESNAGVLTEHPKTVALTELGRQQAECIRDFIDHRPDCIVHSSYARSLQTALPLMEKFPQARREEWPIQEFTYLSPSKYYQTTKTDRHFHSNVYWQKADPEQRDGEGESFYDFFDRMVQTYERLRQVDEKTVLFTHGHVIRMLLWFYLGGVPRRRPQTFVRYRALRQGLYIPNGSLVAMNLGAKPSLSPLSIDHLPPDLISNTEKFPPSGGGALDWA